MYASGAAESKQVQQILTEHVYPNLDKNTHASALWWSRGCSATSASHRTQQTRRCWCRSFRRTGATLGCDRPAYPRPGNLAFCRPRQGGGCHSNSD
jgi:hypothetical protein